MNFLFMYNRLICFLVIVILVIGLMVMVWLFLINFEVLLVFVWLIRNSSFLLMDRLLFIESVFNFNLLVFF